MQLFRPLDYLKIAIANHYGLDKKTWDERLSWFNNIGVCAIKDATFAAKLFNEASEPMQFIKMCNQYYKAMNNELVDGLVGLDSTASGKMYAP
jgi:DNA-directed RNA polymerase